MDNGNNLLILWKTPGNLSYGSTAILSFLSPAEEEELKLKFKDNVFSAREVCLDVKPEAIKAYINFSAKIASTPLVDGQTLREALRKKDGISLWWFHKVSHKDCESDPAFRRIVEMFTIVHIANKLGIKNVILFGASKEVAIALKDVLKVKQIGHERGLFIPWLYLKGMLSRVRYFFEFLNILFLIKDKEKIGKNKFDIVFSGFWDWSVSEDGSTHKVNDYYFKSLPDLLSSQGLMVGWFLWLDPHGKPRLDRRKLKDAFFPLSRHKNLIPLQSLISMGELLRVLFDFKPHRIFLKFFRNSNFKNLFKQKGLNFYPIFEKELHYRFLNCDIPNFELVYMASFKAFREFNPKIFMSFLELFLHSRAMYYAAKSASKDIISCAVQHASYSREKTFVLLDPESEYNGSPDNCSVPTPDYLFAMGQLGKEIFIENGFPAGNIFLTGSSRYNHIVYEPKARPAKPGNFLNLLLATSLDINLEMDMVEAVCVATNGLSGIRLFLRNHPFAKMQENPKFYLYKDRIEITNQTLEKDLKMADLMIFSYSTLAEEALIKGIPVWQWIPFPYNGSVFRDLKIIPSFCSIAAFRKSLGKIRNNYDFFIPSEQARKTVMNQCFCAEGKYTCINIAKRLFSLFNGDGCCAPMVEDNFFIPEVNIKDD